MLAPSHPQIARRIRREDSLSGALDDVICAEWISEREVPPSRWLLYRDIPRGELDVLFAKIRVMAEDMTADGSAQTTDEHAPQALTKLSDRDLMAKILSIGARNGYKGRISAAAPAHQ
jgi:hypothetical protein